ncbi:MAG TPA: PEGA domain-containing protein [Polyangiales bacterium]|nr:PEGA domain-containing protein [Polyangiales bacterium]
MTEARKDRRAPASIKVKYKSANMTEFVELVGGDVSRGGIFVKTKKPLEPGALLKFEFQLQGGEPMIYGVGRVAWRRTEEGSRANLPAGMGIKFIKLNGLSKSVIDRIEARHGPGSRFDQMDGAEIATAMSSAPPTGMSQAPGDFAPSIAPSANLITPLRPQAARDAAEADAVAATRVGPGKPVSESGRAQRSSPPLREARTTGPKSGAALPATFRPPPPAAVGSVPPPHAAPSSHPPGAAPARSNSSGAFGVASSNAANGSGSSSGSLSSPPRGVLSSGAPARRAVATRSAARDASEFLASAFTVGGAGREVRSEAHAQVERARHDPHSVDLANELFGDLNAPTAKPDAALDADPMLNELSAKGPANSPPPAATSSRSPLADRLSAAAGADTARLRTSPKPVANDQLSLKLGASPVTGVSGVTTERPSGMSGRAVWIAGIAFLGVGIGAAAFYLQRAADHDVVPEVPPPAAAAPVAQPPSVAPPVEAAEAPKPAEAVVTVELPVTSEPAGADVTVDGAPVGATPVTLKLSEGKTVQVSVHKAGYATKSESVTAAANMPARSVTLEALPFEVVVTEPVGATVKVLDKSGEAPLPIRLGAKVPDELTVTVDKAGFQRATRKVTRAEFVEQGDAMRAALSMPLQPTAAAARAAKAPPPKAAAKAPAAAPETQAPPEPETAAAPAAEAKHEEKAAAPAEPTPAPTPAPEAQAKPEPAPAAPAPAPAAPDKPPASDIPTDL